MLRILLIALMACASIAKAQDAAAWMAVMDAGLLGFPAWNGVPYDLDQAISAFPSVFNQVGGDIAYTNGPAHGAGSSAFAGGVLLPNGKALLVPYNSDYVGIYDPASNTYTNGPAHGAGDSAFIGGVLLPNGKALLVSLNSYYVGLINGEYSDMPVNAVLSPIFNKL